MTQTMKQQARSFFVVALLAACDGSDPGNRLPSDPVGTVRAFEDRLNEGDATVFWDALPAGYREDVEGHVALFADEMDPGLWESVFGLVEDVESLFAEQEELLLEVARSKAEEDGKAFQEDEWRHGIEEFRKGLEELLASDMVSLERMRTADLRAFLAGAPSRLMRAGRATGETREVYGLMLGAGAELSIELVEESGDSAVVEIASGDGESQRVELVRVEGSWLPSEMVSRWQVEMDEAGERLDGLFEGPNAKHRATCMQLVGTAGGVVDGLRAARTPEEFRATATQGMFSLIGAVLGSGLHSVLEGTSDSDGS